MTLKQVAVMLALAALWGGSYLLIRIAVPAFGPMSLMAVRVGIAAIVLWIGLGLTRRTPTELRKNAAPLIVVGAVNGAIPFALIAGAEVHLTASLAAVLGATVPLFSVLIGAAWLGQRVSARQALGLLMGVGGVAVLVGWSPMALTTETMLGVGALLLASASYAFSGLFTRAKLAHLPSTTIALGQQVGATALLLEPALLNPPPFPIPGNALWAVLALAVLCTSLAFLLYFYLLAEIGALRTQTVTYLIPVFGMAWGALFLDEPITRGMVVGLGVILASVLLVNRAPRATSMRLRPERSEGPALGD
jgi:drug/metabolite transporter (DMT)-like permease